MVVVNMDPLHYWQLKWGMWSILHDRQQTAVHHLLSTLQVTLEASLAQQFSQQDRKAHSFLKRASSWTSSWTCISSKFDLSTAFNYTHLKNNVTTLNLPNILWSSLFHLQLAELFQNYSLEQHWNCVLCTTESLRDSSRPQESILETTLSSLRIPPTSPWNKHTSCRKSPRVSKSSKPAQIHNSTYNESYIEYIQGCSYWLFYVDEFSSWARQQQVEARGHPCCSRKFTVSFSMRYSKWVNEWVSEKVIRKDKDNDNRSQWHWFATQETDDSERFLFNFYIAATPKSLLTLATINLLISWRHSDRSSRS